MALILFFKARGWFSPEHGGTHRKHALHEDGKDLGGSHGLPSSAGLASLSEARAYWRAHFGGKTIALTVHSGEKEIPIRVRFGMDNDHAYTDSRDGSGKKLPHRVFREKRTNAMSRLLMVIEYPQRRLRNIGAILLLERRIGGEHFTVVLTWRDAAKVYEFHSAHFKPVDEVMRLQKIAETRKNKGPL